MRAIGRFKGWAAVAVVLMVAGAFAQDRPKIAVYVTGDVPNNEKEALGTRILTSLVNSGRYIAIERSNAFLAEIDKEHVKQRSGAIDDGQISKLGKQFGVKFVCIAAITPAFGDFQVSARIIDVETAVVVFIGESASPLKSMADLARVSDQVVKNMFGGQTMSAQEYSQGPTTVSGDDDRPIGGYADSESKRNNSIQQEYKTMDVFYDEPDGKPRILKNRIGVEIGGIFSPYSYYAGYYRTDDYMDTAIHRYHDASLGGGAYMRIDMVFCEIILMDAIDANVWVSMPTGIFLKYPLVYGLVKVSPIMGYGIINEGSFNLIFGGRIDVGISEIAYMRSEYLYRWATGYNGSSLKIGGGLDIGLGERRKTYLRPELLYNWISTTDYDGEEEVLRSLQLRLGIGYKWGGNLKTVQVKYKPKHKILSAGVGGFYDNLYGNRGGAYGYFDATYAEVFLGGLGDDVSFGALAKYPFGSESVKVFPLAGGHATGPAFFAAFGGGIDFNMQKDIHLRSEILYNYHRLEGDFVTIRGSVGYRFFKTPDLFQYGFRL